MNHALCCTNCGEIVVKAMADGSTKLRAKVIVFKESQAVAVCKGCNSEIPVPLTVDEHMLKSIAETKRLRLYVRK